MSKKLVQPKGADLSKSAKTETVNKPETKTETVIDAKLEVVKRPTLDELEADLEKAGARFEDAGWQFAKAVTAIHDSELYPHAGETDGFYTYMLERWNVKRAQAANYVAWVKHEIKLQIAAVPLALLDEQEQKSTKVDSTQIPPPDKPVNSTVTKSREARQAKKQEPTTDEHELKRRAFKRIKAAQKIVGNKRNPDLWWQDLGEIINERSEVQLVSYIQGTLSKEGYQANKVARSVTEELADGTKVSKIVEMTAEEAQAYNARTKAKEASDRNEEKSPVTEVTVNAGPQTGERKTGEVDQKDVVLSADSEVQEYPSYDTIERLFRDWLPAKWGSRYPTDVLKVVIAWAREEDLDGTKDILADAWADVNSQWEAGKELQETNVD